jgi:microcin C transport system substrate-binding protein
VLRSLHIWVPNWHYQTHIIAYLDVYRRPDKPLPPYAMGELGFWWFDQERADELKTLGAF